MKKLIDPAILVDRRAREVACFDHINLIRAAKRYVDEEAGIHAARLWFAKRTRKTPRVVIARACHVTAHE